MYIIPYALISFAKSLCLIIALIFVGLIIGFWMLEKAQKRNAGI